MKTESKTKIAFTLFVLFISSFNLISGTKFLDSVYSSIKIERDTEYSRNTSYTGDSVSLKFDFFQPENDVQHLKPLVIWIHGGSFMGGKRQDPRIQYFCENLAKKGYAAATIDYRTGIDFKSKDAQAALFESVYRAMQDTKTAVRYFKKNYKKYGIDSSKIIVAGYSAGAFSAIQSAYMRESDVPKWLDSTFNNDFENSAGYEGISSSFRAVIGISGGIADTNWIHKNGIPVLCFHGTKDMLVPYTSGKIFGGNIVFGSKDLVDYAKAHGIDAQFYTFEGGGHGIPKDKMQFTLDKIAEFLYKIINN